MSQQALALYKVYLWEVTLHYNNYNSLVLSIYSHLYLQHDVKKKELEKTTTGALYRSLLVSISLSLCVSVLSVCLIWMRGMVFLYCGAAEECKQIEIEGLIVEDNHVL